MEINDIVKEYAQQVNPTTEQPQTESSFKSEAVLADVALTEVQSAPPQEASNESAYDSILTGKTNVSNEPAPIETIEQNQIEELDSSNFDEDASGLEDVIDEDDFIKTKTDGQFESWEQLIEALNEEKVAPTFENEMSELVYNMIAEGNIDEIVEIVAAKKFAEDIQGGSDEEVIKAYIRINNPEFDDEDIDAEFNDSYTIDEYQFDESKLRREQKKLTQRMKSDVDAAKEFFDSLAQEITFPELSTRQMVQEPTEDSSEMDALIQEQRSMYINSLQGVENRVNSLPFSWKDEKANLTVNGKFDIPSQDVSRYREAAEDLENYQVNRYYKDGQYQADKLVKELYLVDNFDKIVNSAISQAVNQTRLEMLRQSKNIQSELEPTGTFKPSAAEEERSMLDQLFMGHLKRQL